MRDFRAAERPFQLLVQVAGRAGRGKRPGRVLIQTYQPNHPAVQFATTHDVKGFAEAELAARRELNYPPFSRLALVRFDAVQETLARDAADRLAQVARQLAEDSVEILGGPAAPSRACVTATGSASARARRNARLRLVLLGDAAPQSIGACAWRSMDPVTCCSGGSTGFDRLRLPCFGSMVCASGLRWRLAWCSRQPSQARSSASGTSAAGSARRPTDYSSAR
jgi:hypothetical protein